MPTSKYHIVLGSQQHNFEAKLDSSSQAGEVWFTNEKGYKRRAFRFNNWIMGCCGAMSMERFAYGPVDWDKVKKLLSAISGQHSPKEIFFILIPYQTYWKGAATSQLIQRPDVKLVDTFTNKVHSGTKLSLYRWSFLQDFSK